MTTRTGERREGFTLVELMIVVAILGILAAVAIPSFQNYQLTSKRAEAYANLASLAKAQKAYFAEFNDYIFVLTEPSTTLGVNPTSTKRNSAPITAAFATVGWTPDGDVFYDYDTNTPVSGGCTCVESCFTSAAYGDLDGNGLISVVLYAQPDALGNSCPTALIPQSPPVGGNGVDPQWDTVVRSITSDVY